ncbi:MAG: HAMP domain-containing sensor histidine kinase [Clostridium sp.]|uniref:sensor histidine kinase n=1 Tax=Clostridium sp. TaxID=1506 RepID=UPI0039EA89D4
MKINIIREAKISAKLTIIYAFMFSFILLILNASVLYGIKHYFYSQANKQLVDVKNIILNDIGEQKENNDTIDKKILINLPSRENLYIKLTEKDGKIVNIPERYYYNVKVNEDYDKIIHLEEKDRHLIYENVKIENNNYGIKNLQIIKDMGREYDFMKILFFFMAVSDFIGIVSSIIIGYIISKKMLKPIDNITKAAENISINNLNERIDMKGPEDELKRLAATFNNMINRLQDSFNRQTQFVSDASHELRTPIAVISGYVNLLDRWGKNDKKALEKSIYAIKFEVSTMADMIEKLLFLAKGDSGVLEMNKTRFFLNKLIDEVIEESRLIDKTHNILSEKNQVVEILADYKMIKQMFRIFIDNSIKFTPENGNIVLNSVIKEKTIEMTISDTGIGIPKEEIERIFDRFYTVDKSRSKDKGGTGLGLSIAKWIVDRHNGNIEVISEEGKGTRIIIKININYLDGNLL